MGHRDIAGRIEPRPSSSVYDDIARVFLGDEMDEGPVDGDERVDEGRESVELGLVGSNDTEREAGRGVVDGPCVERMVMGHLPVLGAAWASHYVRQVARQEGRLVGCVRIQSGYVTVELVGEGAGGLLRDWEGEERGDDSLAGALRRVGMVTDRWVLRVDAEATEGQWAQMPTGREGLRLTTLLTGEDEAAMVAAYRTLKGMAQRGAGEHEDVRVVVIGGGGREGKGAREAGGKLAEAAQTFLGMDVDVRTCAGKIESDGVAELVYSGRYEDELGVTLEVIEDLACDTRLRGGERGDGRAHRGARSGDAEASEALSTDELMGIWDQIDREPVVEGAAEATAPPEQERVAAGHVEEDAEAEGGRQEPSGGLAQHLEGMGAVGIRCPFSPGVEFGVDAEGGMAVLMREQGEGAGLERCVEMLMGAAGWWRTHGEMLCGVVESLGGVRAGCDVAMHLFVEDPREVRGLLESDVRVHLLREVEVGGECAAVCVPLN